MNTLEKGKLHRNTISVQKVNYSNISVCGTRGSSRAANLLQSIIGDNPPKVYLLGIIDN